ncbi:MAG: tetratricopeptide repeat protein [Bacteroidota bacterium]
MKKGLLFLGLILCLAAACQQKFKEAPSKETLLTEIGRLEEQILKTGDASEEKELALALVDSCIVFSDNFPDHPSAPDLLFKAADVARGAKEHGKAVQLWGRLKRRYADHPKAPMALFLQGFTFDSELRDARMASKYYRDFLKAYPNDSLVPQVNQLLQVVEMSPEELVKQFESNQ